MFNESQNLRNRLLDAQEMNPAMREACQKKLSTLLEHTLTPRTRTGLFVLMLLLLMFTIVGGRSLLFYSPGPLVYGSWTVFTVSSAAGAAWIGCSIWRGRFLWSSYFRASDAFTVAATLITTLALGSGARTPSDPSSVFWAVYAFVLLVICVAWSLYCRISAAELAVREHMLRIEYRLATIRPEQQEK